METIQSIGPSQAKLYIEAGKILGSAMKYAEKKARPGKPLLELAEEIEAHITESGARPAFPVNLSKNNQAAHYTPGENDKAEIGEDVLKIDIGTHVDGFVADAAFTMDFSQENGKLVEATERALENALSIARQGMAIGKIGEEIEKTIKSFGFEPVYNLTGHGLGQWEAHSFPGIPNHASNDTKTLEDGMAIAIEPFASTGKGHVSEYGSAEIFSLEEKKPCRSNAARKIIEFAEKEYRTLPFAERWLKKIAPESERKIAEREMMQRNILHAYPILQEKQGILISQAENSIIFLDGKAEVLVKK